MEFITIVGLAAAFLTTISFVPQAAKIWKTKSAKDFSWAWLALFSTGVALWFAYGFTIGDVPIIAANLATMLLLFTMMFFKFKHG